MKTAMILAAGRGERLKPITNVIPKALCLVKGRPLIEYHIIHLAKAGFKRIIINHAHLGGQIRRLLGNGKRFGIELYFAPEPPGGLETGGGLYNARPLLGDEPFLALNADIFTDFDFSTLCLPQGSWAHLVLGPNPKHNLQGDFSLNTQQKLSRDAPRHTFLGIAIYHPQAFEAYAPGRYSVVPMIDSLIQANKASGEFFGGLWMDIGTKERLLEVNEGKLPLQHTCP